MPGLAQWVKNPVFPISCHIGPIQPLAGERPYAAGAAVKRKRKKEKKISHSTFFFLVFLRAAPAAHGSSQARGLIRAIIAPGLCHSHSYARSEQHVQPTPQLKATPDP